MIFLIMLLKEITLREFWAQPWTTELKSSGLLLLANKYLSNFSKEVSQLTDCQTYKKFRIMVPSSRSSRKNCQA